MDETDRGQQLGTEPGVVTATSTETSAPSDEVRSSTEVPLQRGIEPISQFATPSWMGPGLAHTPRPAAVRNTAQAPAQVPVQAQPAHDALEASPTLTPSIPMEAHWIERRRPRVLVGVVLTLAILGAIGCLVVTIISQAVTAIVGLVLCTALAVVFRGALMSAGVTLVDLKGSTLSVRNNGMVDLFNLADPSLHVDLISYPDRPDWKVVLVALSGRQIELNATHVDAAAMHRVVEFYRAVAERSRAEHRQRFNR